MILIAILINSEWTWKIRDISILDMRESITLLCPVLDSWPLLSSEQRKKLKSFLRGHEGEFYTLYVSEKGKPRSLRQNSYLWGVVYSYIAEETGHSTEEAHEYCKARFLPKMFKTLKEGLAETEVQKSTTELTTEEMEQYLERVRAFAAEELFTIIPLPNETPTP
jgi:hypothetical protein